jgi:plastocyanin
MVFNSHRTIILLASIVLASTVVMHACGGAGTTSAPSAPSDQPGGASQTVITITARGVSPKNVTVPVGGQITFVNNDTIDHQMFSDPHPEHTDCPDINQVGFLTPGQSRQTGNLNIVRTCGFHDHGLPLNTSLQGTITTQ